MVVVEREPIELQKYFSNSSPNVQIVSSGCRGAGLHRGGPLVGNSSSDSNIKMTGFAFFKRFFFNPIYKGPHHTMSQNASDAIGPNKSEILAVKWSIMKVINCKFEMNISDFFSKIRVA